MISMRCIWFEPEQLQEGAVLGRVRLYGPASSDAALEDVVESDAEIPPEVFAAGAAVLGDERTVVESDLQLI